MYKYIYSIEAQKVYLFQITILWHTILFPVTETGKLDLKGIYFHLGEKICTEWFQFQESYT